MAGLEWALDVGLTRQRFAGLFEHFRGRGRCAIHERPEGGPAGPARSALPAHSMDPVSTTAP